MPLLSCKGANDVATVGVIRSNNSELSPTFDMTTMRNNRLSSPVRFRKGSLRSGRLLKHVSQSIAAIGLIASSVHAADVFVPGFLKYEYFPGATRADAENGVAAANTGGTTVGSDKNGFITSAESGTNFADNYANRISGFFVPPSTADYVFLIASDDDSDLFLSTDDTPANKKLIAQESGWSGVRNYATVGGGSTTENKRSDSFASSQWPGGNTIHLTGGSHYYIEAVHHEGGGGDNVAVTYKLATEDDALVADGTAPRLTGSVIGVSGTPASTLTITNQPLSTTNFAGTQVRFSVGASTDSAFPIQYQFRRNGTNILNATSSSYSFVSTSANNNDTYDVVLTVPGKSVTSSIGKLTVNAGAITVNGAVKDEYFSGATRQNVENGNVGIPTYVDAFPSFASPVNIADNYTRRVSGLFTPATTGSYVFFVASDDDTDLFLSTDSSPANKRLIAQETGWSNVAQWITSPSSSVTQKRSDLWSPDGGTTKPFATGIALTAGTKYYIEAVHHEGGGGDHVEVTFKLAADPDPVDGDATKLTNNLIAYVTSPVTSGSITTQPVGVTNYESQSLTLSVGATTDSELRPLYQWQKNGVNITNATSSSFSINPVGTGDSGNYDVVVTIPNSTIAPIKSSVVPVLVQPSPFVKGYLKYEYFPGGTVATAEAGTAGSPSFAGTAVGSDKSGAVAGFEAGTNFADNYANRISGFFTPTTTGDYNFIIATDDDSDLFLSTDDKAANKRLIAQETGWSGVRNWNSSNGGSATQKNSSTYSPDAGATTPFASGIHLVAGTRYYIEAVHHEGGGGDNLAVTYYTAATGIPDDGTAPAFTSNEIGIQVPPQTLTITAQPQSVSAQVNQTASFNIAVNTTGFYPPNIQFQKNGVDIPGATGTNYTTGLLTTADNGAKITANVSILGSLPITSTVANLTVAADTTAPTVVSASGSLGRVLVTFSEPLDATSAGTAANYKLDGGATVTSATVTNYVQGSYAVSVVNLGVTGLTSGKNYNLTVTGVKDTAGNSVAAGTTVPVTVYGISLDFNSGQLPEGTALGAASSVQLTGGPDGSGYLLLTTNVGSLAGAFSIPDLANGATVTNFTMTFKLFIGNGSGNAADGMSFNFGTDVADAATGAGEEGSGTGISVDFDTYDNGATGPLVNGVQVEEAPAIEVKFNGEIIGFVPVAKSTLVTGHWADTTIQLNSDNTINVSYDGTNYFTKLKLIGATNLVTGAPVGATYAPLAGASFLIGARTGGEFETHAIDNLAIIENASVAQSTNGSPATITVARTSTGLTLSWAPTGGTLQSTTALKSTGTVWTDVGTANPATITVGTTGSKFFRIKN